MNTKTPGAALIDYLQRTYNLKNDAAVARRLDMAPPMISKMRKGIVKVGAFAILRIHEVLGAPVRTIREVLAGPV